MPDSRAEEILKKMVGDPAELKPPMSRGEVLLYRLMEKIDGMSIDNPIKIMGRVDTVNDLPSNAEPGWMYFVGTEDAAEFKEYIFTELSKWELIGTSDVDLSEYLKIVDAVGKKESRGGERFNTAASASGESAHAEGSGTQATGAYSHAEGGGSQATNTSAHAEGGGTQATSSFAHSEGGGTLASGIGSHAEGQGTKATGDNAHAEGYSTQANGNNSHAGGTGTIANGTSTRVNGRYNIPDSNGEFADIIGNGYSTANRSNAYTLDWNGNVWYSGNLSLGADNATLTPEKLSNLHEIYTLTEQEYEALENPVAGAVYFITEEEEEEAQAIATNYIASPEIDTPVYNPDFVMDDIPEIETETYDFPLDEDEVTTDESDS